MAVFPNANSVLFCEFLQDATYLDITAPRLVVIQEVLDAGNAATSVTNAVWNNFMLATGEYYQYYVAYYEQTKPWITYPSAIAQGDMLYGSATNVLSSLAKNTGTSRFIKNSGSDNNPAWAQPALTDLSDNTEWTNYTATSTIVGWSSFHATEKYLLYRKIGTVAFVIFDILGTSNSTAVTMTLPFSCKSVGTSFTNQAQCTGINNGTVTVGSLASISQGSSTLTIYRDGNATPWTASGNKYVGGQIMIPL